jgi:hypothetical protein
MAQGNCTWKSIDQLKRFDAASQKSLHRAMIFVSSSVHARQVLSASESVLSISLCELRLILTTMLAGGA